MSIPDGYRELIGSLVMRTQLGQVNWKSTAGSDRFVIYFKDFSLGISSESHGGGYGGEPWSAVSVTLYDKDGNSMDQFTLADDDPDYKNMEGLHASARRKALRIDEAISTLMNQLEADEPIGDDPPPADDDLPF